MRDLVLPGRYYCRWPFKQPRGYQFEEQRLNVDDTAFFLIDVSGKGYDEGDPAPEFPHLFLEEMFFKERDIIRHRIRPALDAARAAGLKVVYTTNYWEPGGWDESEFGKLVFRAESGWAGTLEETEAGESQYVQFSGIVAPRPGDFVVRKTMYDGFFQTNLDTLFRNLRVKNLVCAGFTADICLLNTVVGAMYHNYRVVVLRDCTVGAEFVDTLEEMQMTWFGIRCIEALVGFTATSEEFIAACRRAPAGGS